DRNLAAAVVAIYVHAVGRLAHVAALEAGDCKPEPVHGGAGAGRLGAGLTAALTAGSAGGGAEAHALFGVLAVDLAATQGLANTHALAVRVHAIADAPGELGAVKVAVAVVDDGGGGAVLKLEVGGEVARTGPLGHPAADHGPYAADHAATEQAHGVDEMG